MKYSPRFAKAYRKLYEEGVCIVDDFCEDPDQVSAPDSMYPAPLFACTKDQANYITNKGISRDAIFDGVLRSTYHGGYTTNIEPVKVNKKKITGPGPRLQLKPCKVNGEEMARYAYQQRLILENIFDKKDKGHLKNPANWICKMTNIVGGELYQHPHADQAWPFEYEGEKTFPFVASHGFGIHPHQMWLLTKSVRGKNEYGVLHTLPPSALLLMRGDFVHAGGAMWYPRCHMKFYPRVNAGRVKGYDDNYWLLPNFKKDITEETRVSEVETVFLWQHFNFPFGFPDTKRRLNVERQCIEEVITYPPEVTHRLLGRRSKHVGMLDVDMD